MRTDSIDIAAELAGRRPAEYQGFPGAYIYHDRTPAHEFTTVMAPLIDHQYFSDLASRDFFDPVLAASVLDFVSGHTSGLTPKRPVTILDKFSPPPGYAFESVAVLSPYAAKQYEYENARLSLRTFVVFPIYRCELSGDESAEEIDMIRHEFLDSLDWRRLPCPKISMAFQNKKTGVRSKRAKLGLAKLGDLLAEIDDLHDANGSWIKLQNFIGQICRIQWDKHQYSIMLHEGETLGLDKQRLIYLVMQFVTKGQ
jgi:hypothetical protein